MELTEGDYKKAASYTGFSSVAEYKVWLKQAKIDLKARYPELDLSMDLDRKSD